MEIYTIKRSSFTIFLSVINALFLREIQTRFGTKRLGYFWAIIDPMSKVIMFSIMHSALPTTTFQHIDYPVFLATSFLTYNFFSATMNSSISAFDANKALFSYQQVKPIDTIISRFFVEFLIMSMTIIVFILLGLYINLDLSIENINMTILAVIWLGVFGFSLGILFAVISAFYETFAKVVGFLTLPLFFLSGLMYSVDSLPKIAQDIVLYNPVIHFIEMIHGNYFKVLNTQYVDYTYMFFWTIIPLFLGLLFYTKAQKKIISL